MHFCGIVFLKYHACLALKPESRNVHMTLPSNYINTFHHPIIKYFVLMKVEETTDAHRVQAHEILTQSKHQLSEYVL